MISSPPPRAHSDAGLLARAVRLHVPASLNLGAAALLAPILNAFLARTPEREAAIGGYAVALGIVGLIALPQMRIQQLTLVFLEDRESLARLRRFVAVLALGVGAVAALVAFSPLADLLLQRVFVLSGDLHAEARRALAGLALFAPLAVVRMHLYGAALRVGQARVVWAGTLLGAGLTIGLSAAALATGWPGGALLAAIPVSAASVVEVVALLAFTGRPTRAALPARSAGPPPAYADLTRFFGPLLFAAFLPTVTPPIISAALARTPDPEVAIAAVAVALSINQFLTIGLWGVQSTMLALLGQGDPPARIARLANVIGGLTLALTLLVAFVPVLSDAVIRGLMGAQGALAGDALWGLRLLAPLPLLLVQEAIYASALLRARRTRPLVYINLWRLAALLVYVAITLNVADLSGVVIGVGATGIALVVEALATYVYGRRTLRRLVLAWRSLPAG